MKYVLYSLLLWWSVAQAQVDETKMTPEQLVSKMGVGWNLGNSLDSKGKDETAWGNPKVTPQLIAAVKKAGFDSIRVPVTWSYHLGEAPEYKIEQEWMDRVQEVVDYAINEGFYVILNVHHDCLLYTSPSPRDA